MIRRDVGYLLPLAAAVTAVSAARGARAARA
jgi:hypothetical protein